MRWGDLERTVLQEGSAASAAATPLQDIIDAANDLGLDPREVLVDGRVYDDEVKQ